MREQGKKSFFDLTIKGRLLAGFIGLIIPLIIVMIVILVKINAVENFSTHINDVTLPTLEKASSLDSNIVQTQRNTLHYVITGSQADRTDFSYVWNEINQSKNFLAKYAPLWSDRDFASQWEELKSLYDSLYKEQSAIFALPRDANFQGAALQHLNAITPVIGKMLDLIDGTRSAITKKREGGMLFEEFELIKKGTANLIDSVSTVKTFSVTLVILTILLAIGIALWVTRSISGPLNNAIDIAKRIASGERNIDIYVNSQDETGELLQSLKQMLESIKQSETGIKQNEEKTRHLLDNLEQTANLFGNHTSQLAAGDLRQRLDVSKNDTVLADLGKDLNLMTDGLASISKQVTELSSNMVTTLEEVKSAANVQSTGVTEQAASINEITASIEEIDKSSKQTMEKAKTLGDVARQTREKGTLGIDSVDKSILGMKSVREKVQTIAQTILDLSNLTQQVGEITAVVNTLAQQSKMLALNASIEAAKAGEAGKGFAVVAIEVKNLAEQSEQSTAQVQKILEDIRHGAEKAVMVTEAGTKEVDQGSKLIEKASEVIHDLNNMIQEAAIASQQIEASIRQEGISIEQITAGMGEINQVTNTFVGSVRETMTSLDHLGEIAKHLRETISVYKL